jgi:hypothetical protein
MAPHSYESIILSFGYKLGDESPGSKLKPHKCGYHPLDNQSPSGDLT